MSSSAGLDEAGIGRVRRLTLQFDFRSAPGIGTSHEEMFATYLDMCAWADRQRVDQVVVQLPEHHGSPDGFLPSPIVAAAACVGRTRNVTARLVLLLPLYHPVRLAEDLAVLDLLARGRLELVLAAGYRREEYDAMGVPLSQRGRRMTEWTEALKAAWTGERFEWREQAARVTPLPYQRPRPRFVMGGSSPASARRAARLADGYEPTDPAFLTPYREALGSDARTPDTPHRDRSHVVAAVSEDPTATWDAVAPYCLHETNTYADWIRDGSGIVLDRYRHFRDVEELRSDGPYVVLAPEDCVPWAQERGGHLSIQPLLGGLPTSVGWETLHGVERALDAEATEGPRSQGVPASQ